MARVVIARKPHFIRPFGYDHLQICINILLLV